MYSSTFTDSDAPDIPFLASLSYQDVSEPAGDMIKESSVDSKLGKQMWACLETNEVVVYFSRYLMDVAVVCVDADEVYFKEAGVKMVRKVLDVMGSS